ncbi:outer membrane protein [Mesorhizobium sp. M0510]|uniref:outer membrane protein n=1 Tax=unclassified Mesorhizobium TaxID=325217 RepID=UPI0033380FB2
MLPVGTTVCILLFAQSAARSADVLPSHNWSGAYAGFDAGYIAGKSHFVFTEEEGSGASPGNFADSEARAFIGGVYAGYNFQSLSNVVFGVEGDIAYSNSDDFADMQQGGAPLEGGEDIGERLQWTGSARLRAGYAVGRFLPYIAGGLALARAEISYQDRNGRSSLGTQTLEGWTIGAGIDYLFSNHLIGRAEYRHSDFGTDNFKMGVPTT